MSEQVSVHIDAPVERVFAWFRDPRNWPSLNPSAQEKIIRAHVPEEGLGTFHVWAMRPMRGVRFEIFGVFTEFEVNRRIVDRWSMAIEGTETYRFEPEGAGTRFTLSRQRRSVWRLGLLDGLVSRLEGREDERVLGRLKDRLESPENAAATPH